MKREWMEKYWSEKKSLLIKRKKWDKREQLRMENGRFVVGNLWVHGTNVELTWICPIW